MTPEDAYHELCGYTLTLRDPEFIHQHVVDAYTAQTADAHTKPIKLTFALVGLHLHLVKRFSGKQVQRTHMFLAGRETKWPAFPLPESRGDVTAANVLIHPPGPERAQAVDVWCASVWAAYRASHQAVADLLRTK